MIGSPAPLSFFHMTWEAIGIYEAGLVKVRPVQALTPYISTSLGTCKENQRKSRPSDTTDPDLNRNARNYRDNHKYRDAREIILHFINVKY